MTGPLPILPTTLVGSWSQPSWLIDRARLDGHVPVRINDHSLWRVDDAWLDEAHDDATIVAVAEQDRLGLDIVTDGEARRESYSNRFANALEGIDHERSGEMLDRTGKHVPGPRVIGPISRARPVERDVVALMKRFTDEPVKITLPGPFTMTQQAQNDYYSDDVELAMAYADAVAAEAVADKPARYDFLAELDRCSVDEISIEAAQPRLDLSVLDELATKRIQFGVLDLRDTEVESVDLVAERIRRALDHVEADRFVVAPDCGCKYLPRAVGQGKVDSMVKAAALVRSEV